MGFRTMVFWHKVGNKKKKEISNSLKTIGPINSLLSDDE